jgi:hypothetical protein
MADMEWERVVDGPAVRRQAVEVELAGARGLWRGTDFESCCVDVIELREGQGR